MPPGGPTGPEGAMLSLVTLSYPQDEFEHAGGGGAGVPTAVSPGTPGKVHESGEGSGARLARQPSGSWPWVLGGPECGNAAVL